MTEFLVVEIQIWLFATLLILGVGVLVGLWFYGRSWLRKHDAGVVATTSERVESDANVRRNRMLIRLDHELKNPLTALRAANATMRDLVADPTVPPEQLTATLDAVDGSSRRVARLLADLRRLADVETRQIDFVRVDMDMLVHQAVEDARTAPGAEDRTIVATVARAPWRLPHVAGEEDMLHSAVLNLLGNAIKYSHHPDVVELRANEQIIDGFRWVVVEVADTGMGIPPGEQAQVWEELSRGQEVRAVPGSGMGLALVRSIVHRHGGSVELFSQTGIGTSVRLVLPVLDDSQAPVGPEQQKHPAPPIGAENGFRPVQPFQDDRKDFHPQQQYQPPLTGAHEQYRPRHDFQPPAHSGPQFSGPQQSGPQHSGPQPFGPQQASGPVPGGQQFMTPQPGQYWQPQGSQPGAYGQAQSGPVQQGQPGQGQPGFAQSGFAQSGFGQPGGGFPEGLGQQGVGPSGGHPQSGPQGPRSQGPGSQAPGSQAPGTHESGPQQVGAQGSGQQGTGPTAPGYGTGPSGGHPQSSPQGASVSDPTQPAAVPSAGQGAGGPGTNPPLSRREAREAAAQESGATPERQLGTPRRTSRRRFTGENPRRPGEDSAESTAESAREESP